MLQTDFQSANATMSPKKNTKQRITSLPGDYLSGLGKQDMKQHETNQARNASHCKYPWDVTPTTAKQSDSSTGNRCLLLLLHDVPKMVGYGPRNYRKGPLVTSWSSPSCNRCIMMYPILSTVDSAHRFQPADLHGAPRCVLDPLLVWKQPLPRRFLAAKSRGQNGNAAFSAIYPPVNMQKACKKTLKIGHPWHLRAKFMMDSPCL